MTDPLDLDRLAAWADGRLPAAEARALEAQLARDPALAREAEAFRQVQHVTEGLRAETAPPSRLRFDDLRLDDVLLDDALLDDALLDDPAALPRVAGSRIRARWWASGLAAAALLFALTAWALGGFGATGGTAKPESANVVLAAIPLSQEPPEPPAVLLKGYAPVKDAKVAWLAQEAEAAEVARYAGRSVFLYAHVDECPYCQQMDRTSFRDPEVQALLARFVPVQVNVMRLPPEQAQRLFEAGWPYLAVKRADGTVLRELSGLQDAATLRKNLEAAVESGRVEPPTWDQVVKRANRDAGLRDGRTALLAARADAASDPARAREALRSVAARLAGSDAGRDLARVLDAWRAESPFPVLVEPLR